MIANYIQLNSNSNSLLIGEYDDIKEAEEEEEYYDDRIFGIIPNPLAKIHRDVTKSVDSFFENIPLIGWEKNYYTCYYYFTSLLFSEIQVVIKKSIYLLWLSGGPMS